MDDVRRAELKQDFRQASLDAMQQCLPANAEIGVTVNGTIIAIRDRSLLDDAQTGAPLPLSKVESLLRHAGLTKRSGGTSRAMQRQRTYTSVCTARGCDMAFCSHAAVVESVPAGASARSVHVLQVTAAYIATNKFTSLTTALSIQCHLVNLRCRGM